MPDLAQLGPYLLSTNVALPLILVLVVVFRHSVRAGAAVAAAAGLAALALLVPSSAPYVGGAFALTMLPLLHKLTLFRKGASWAAAALLAAPFLVVLMFHLPPRARFDATLGAAVAGMIVAAGLVASLFTLLLLKTFEKLESSFLQAYVLFLPIAAAPWYLAYREILSLAPPGASSAWEWLAPAIALDAVLAGCAVLLLAARLVAGRLSTSSVVTMVAWRFLKSQRLVPTWKTRLLRAKRALVALPVHGEVAPQAPVGSEDPRFALPVHGEVAPQAPVGSVLRRPLPKVGAVALLLSSLAATSGTWLSDDALATGAGDERLVRFLLASGVPLAAAVFFAVSALRAHAGDFLPKAAAAVAVACLGLFGMDRSEGFQALDAGLGAAIEGVALLSLLVLLSQALHRGRLHLARRKGKLPKELDLSLAPPEETRLRHGVGGAVFVSVVGVAIGVWALVVVLSVMGGFSGELKERILKTRDHVMVKAPLGEALSAPIALAADVKRVPGVKSAGPYVEGEGMMSSNVNISATVTIRGVDRTPGALAHLEPLIVAGSLDLFRHPEDLVPFPGLAGAGPPTLPSPTSGEGIGSADAGLVVPPGSALGSPLVGGGDGKADAGLVVPPGSALGSPLAGEPGGRGALAGTAVPPPMPLPPPASSGAAALRPVIIGQELARSLGAGVGSRVQVISPDGEVGPLGVQPKARPFTVAAIFATGMYENDLKLAFMYLPDAQDFFNLGDAIDRLDVRLQQPEATDAAAASIAALAGQGAEVLTWKEMNRNLLSALELERMVMFVVLGFIILIASFNIVTSLVILIRKRLSAIAILKTSGATSGQVTAIFFVLGAAVGLFGIASGLIMGLSSCGVLAQLGLVLPREFYIRQLPVSVRPAQVAEIALAAATVIGLAALYPGRLASRVTVVEGLKDER